MKNLCEPFIQTNVISLILETTNLYSGKHQREWDVICIWGMKIAL